MDITKRDISYESVDSNGRIMARIMEPSNISEIRGIFQIAHGASEHSGIYADIAEYMAQNGLVCAVNDHPGHGKSVAVGGAYGCFGSGGWHCACKDMEKLTDILRREYPKVPFIIAGQGIGGLLAGEYSAQAGNTPDAVIFSGVGLGHSLPALALHKEIAKALLRKNGEKKHEVIFERCTTDYYNQFFAPNRTANDWISADEERVDRYCADPLCGFPLTAAGYHDVFDLQMRAAKRKWYQQIPDIPICILSGKKDPMGNFGNDARRIYRHFLQTGHSADLIEYPMARHALLWGENRKQVYSDIMDFLDKSIFSGVK